MVAPDRCAARGSTIRHKAASRTTTHSAAHSNGNAS